MAWLSLRAWDPSSEEALAGEFCIPTATSSTIDSRSVAVTVYQSYMAAVEKVWILPKLRTFPGSICTDAPGKGTTDPEATQDVGILNQGPCSLNES